MATTRGKKSAPKALPTKIDFELVTERSGVLGYRYRRLRFELQGRRANVKELKLQLDYDLQFELSTKKRDLVRQRGRRVDGAELTALFAIFSKLRVRDLNDHYQFLDSVNPEEVDETIGADGEPIAVSTGEEGPACLTLKWEEDGQTHTKRIVVERFREPDALAVETRRARRAPLAALASLFDAKLKATRQFNYRKTDVVDAMVEEFSSLKARDFVNLHQFERRAVEALGALKDARAVQALSSELFAPDARVRLQALDALATIGDETAVADIELLYYDDESSVREKARRVLKALKTK